MSTQGTLGAMGAAAVALKPSLLEKAIDYTVAATDLVRDKVSGAIDSVMNINNSSNALLTPFSAIYGGVKTFETIDDKVLKIKNKYGKFLFNTLGGITGAKFMTIGAAVGTGIATYKVAKGAGKGLINISKSLWSKGYPSKKEAAA